MPVDLWLKAFALWLVILVLAVLNGVLREEILVPAMGSFAALVTSGTVLSSCILLVAFVGAPWYGRLPFSRWLLVGLSWVLLTLAFEFGFGRFMQRKTWPELLQAYTFEGGNLWPLVLVATLISPWLAAKLRRLG